MLRNTRITNGGYYIDESRVMWGKTVEGNEGYLKCGKKKRKTPKISLKVEAHMIFTVTELTEYCQHLY